MASTNGSTAACGLQNLPMELQLQIFHFAVVEAPRWDRLHDFPCQYKPLKPGTAEPPPFMHTYTTILDDPSPGIHTEARCPCGKRKGINLLLANRAIHAAAAPIFWSQNTFCFMSVVEFTIATTYLLRPEYRDHLQSISFMSHFGRAISAEHVCIPSSLCGRPLMDNFWAAVAQCNNLRSLDIPYPFLEDSPWGPRGIDVSEKLVTIAESARSLEKISLNYFFVYCFELERRESYLWCRCCDYDEGFVAYARVSRLMPLRGPVQAPDGGGNGQQQQEQTPCRWNTETLAAFVRDTHHMLISQADPIIKTRFLGADPDNIASYRHTLRYPEDLNDESRRRRIDLRTGARVPLTFYSVPLSNKNRAKRAKYVIRMDREQPRSNGLASSQREPVDRELNDRWWSKRVDREMKEYMEHEEREKMYADRDARRLQLTKDQRVEAKAEKVAEKQAWDNSKAERQRRRDKQRSKRR